MAYSEQDKKNNIYELQEFLEAISYVNSNIPLVIPDGIYGDFTRDAIFRFQKEYGLAESGEVDIYTWNKLYEEYGNAITNYTGPLPLFPNQSSDLKLKLNDKGRLVDILQVMVNTIAEFYININRLKLTGEFDNPTELEVKNLQAITLQPPTGVVDINTWNAFTKLYNFHTSE